MASCGASVRSYKVRLKEAEGMFGIVLEKMERINEIPIVEPLGSGV